MPKAVDVHARRQSITDAAARLIASAGIGAATMREVANEAGWTTGVVTHYFADKRELLLCTLQASLEGRRLRHADDLRGNPTGALRATLAAALPLDESSRRHWLVTVAFCSEAAGDAELAAVQRDAYREFRAHVVRLVEQATGRRGADAVADAERLIALTNGVAMQALFDEDSWPADRQLATLDAALVVVDPVAG